MAGSKVETISSIIYFNPWCSFMIVEKHRRHIADFEFLFLRNASNNNSFQLRDKQEDHDGPISLT